LPYRLSHNDGITIVFLLRNVDCLNHTRCQSWSGRLVLVKLVDEAYISYTDDSVRGRYPDSIDVGGVIAYKETLKGAVFEFVTSRQMLVKHKSTASNNVKS
jgi:hypothetical protein